jgi:hypothetical protein
VDGIQVKAKTGGGGGQAGGDRVGGHEAGGSRAGGRMGAAGNRSSRKQDRTGPQRAVLLAQAFDIIACKVYRNRASRTARVRYCVLCYGVRDAALKCMRCEGRLMNLTE